MNAHFSKRKIVRDEVLDQGFSLPKENQTIVQIKKSAGNNLHEVETGNGEIYLTSMPAKFRKSVWVKTGHFVIVEPILEGTKVKAEMVAVLTNDYIKFIVDKGAWPEKFSKVLKTNVQEEILSSEEDSDSESGLEKNPNRLAALQYESSSEEETDSDAIDSGHDSEVEKK